MHYYDENNKTQWNELAIIIKIINKNKSYYNEL